jgi:hypothetical protein
MKAGFAIILAFEMPVMFAPNGGTIVNKQFDPDF